MKERCSRSRDPELLGVDGELYPITHFSHGGEGSQLSNWNIHWASEPPKCKSGKLPQRQDFEDRTLRENNG
ncbi:hypothetical protein H5410_051171 [Solanum commersonii]|uniref:Uncharacterized protein n=1 Tax=Solanum commersonii TaxID=4109 RepID=A0A9J5X062_SOLCO|nr:hypothetical protein H5410_051171 [Solanum commersonii]